METKPTHQDHLDRWSRATRIARSVAYRIRQKQVELEWLKMNERSDHDHKAPAPASCPQTPPKGFTGDPVVAEPQSVQFAEIRSSGDLTPFTWPAIWLYQLWKWIVDGPECVRAGEIVCGRIIYRLLKDNNRLEMRTVDLEWKLYEACTIEPEDDVMLLREKLTQRALEFALLEQELADAKERIAELEKDYKELHTFHSGGLTTEVMLEESRKQLMDIAAREQDKCTQ